MKMKLIPCLQTLMILNTASMFLTSKGTLAMAQVWMHKNANATQAALWVIRRTDGFQHSHVVRELLLDQGMDLFVLNWRYNGMNILRG